jgi:integrase/recombinase XerD
METDGQKPAALLGSLAVDVDSFLDDLRATGYAPAAVTKRRSIVTSFIRWIQAKRVEVPDLSDAHLAAFLKRRPHKWATPKERPTVRRFLAHVRARRMGAPPAAMPVSPAEEFAQRYVAFLRTERGLAENSILVYAPPARDFLAYRVSRAGSLALDALDAEAVRAFLVERIANRSFESSRLLTVSLRSLLRFLFLRGETPRDLSAAVPMVRTYRQSTVPAGLSPEEVECVLATPDPTTARGRRDSAILLLLARLGLRASEIISLEVGDLRWRAGEIVVRGKGPRLDHVPLLADVGEAVARYLHTDRGLTRSRRVFLRLIPPRVGLSRPCAVDHIVRLALARAGIRPRHRRVAHLFRHSLATRMIRHGASIAEIAEVLRHRSQTTTAIYAKVSFEALRGVARPWPVSGGAR